MTGRPFTPATLAEARRAAAGIDYVTIQVERARKRRDYGKIYFLACNDFVKIGFATDIRGRVRRIQSLCPYELKVLATIKGSITDEVALHKRFAEYRTHGEWFRHEGELQDHIASIVESRDG